MQTRLAVLAAATTIALTALAPSALASTSEQIEVAGNGAWTCTSYNNASSPKPPTQGVIGQPADSCRVP
jgi:hypothetical protein